MSQVSPKHKFSVIVGTKGIEVGYEREWQSNEDNVIRYGDPVAILVCDGTFWQANLDNEARIMALAKHIKAWELFKIVAVGDEYVSNKKRTVRYNDQVAFRALANQSFVGAQLISNNGELTARVPWVKEWEMFKLVQHPQKPVSLDRKLRYGSWFALQAYNRKFVMFDRDNSKQSLAFVSQPDEWEAFVFINPDDYP